MKTLDSRRMPRRRLEDLIATMGSDSNVTVESWRRFLKEFGRPQAASREERGKGPVRQWVYRGESDVTRDFKPHLERTLDEFEVPSRERLKYECVILREFMRKFHHYDPTRSPRALLEWMAVLRHHGGPVRLLDWSYSPFVAAFFALAGAKRGKDCEVWALDAVWCRAQMPRKVSRSAKRLVSDLTGFEAHDDEGVLRALLRQPTAMVCPVNPFKMNERLTIQQGLFLLPGDVSRPFVENLRETAKGDWSALGRNMRHILITSEARVECLLGLRRMNMSKDSLFPGLDGFAESLALSWWFLDPNPRFPEVARNPARMLLSLVES